MQAQRGFTLLELLVVVFIIGIVLSIPTLTVAPSEGRLLEQEAKRIYKLMELAREEAIINAQEIAFSLTASSYRFEVYNTDSWQPLEDAEFRERALPEHVRVELHLADEPVQLASEKQQARDEKEDKEKADKEKADKDKADKDKESEKIERVFLLSSGEVTPFELIIHFESEEDGFSIEGNEMGELTFKDRKITL